MKAHTSIKQSKKLAEILPIDSADMWYGNEDHYKIAVGKWKDNEHDEDDVPCWSLAALLDIIPYPTLGKHANETWSCASWVEKVNPYFVEGCDSPINACYEMIVKLHEQNLL